MGQQAFELAEAGIEIAKAHLADDPNFCNWSSGSFAWKRGRNAVTVEHDENGSPFRATSTREYGGSKRRIYAVFSIEDGRPEVACCGGSSTGRISGQISR